MGSHHGGEVHVIRDERELALVRCDCGKNVLSVVGLVPVATQSRAAVDLL
jgi:hypothetical protein